MILILLLDLKYSLTFTKCTIILEIQRYTLSLMTSCINTLLKYIIN